MGDGEGGGGGGGGGRGGQEGVGNGEGDFTARMPGWRYCNEQRCVTQLVTHIRVIVSEHTVKRSTESTLKKLLVVLIFP